MKKAASLLAVVLLILASSAVSASAQSYPSGVIGQDISWPNCNTLKFKPTVFGIVGVNGGLSFYPNKCVGEEASLYRQNLSLYANTGFPGSPYDLKYKFSPDNCMSLNPICLAYNYGYNAGKYAANYSLMHGVVSNNWWLDVETINSWSTNYKINRASISAEADAIRESLKPNYVGYYAYPIGWTILTNNWRDFSDAWVATNSNYKSVAIKECAISSFNGGKVVLTQYIGKTDLDLAC